MVDLVDVQRAIEVKIEDVENYENDLPTAALAAFRNAITHIDVLSGEDAAAVRGAVKRDMNVVDIYWKLRQIFQEDLTESEREEEEPNTNTAQSQKTMPSEAMAFLEECGVDLDNPTGFIAPDYYNYRVENRTILHACCQESVQRIHV